VLIAERHNGELLVGVADIVETDNANIHFLFVAPTMRVPMRLTKSVNPYLAARAIFLLVQHGRFVSGPQQGGPLVMLCRTIALPGLGTGVGGVGPGTCPHQVQGAIEKVRFGMPKPPGSWAEASERHRFSLRS
jgi:O-acetyl-ADP-ribose deacetylase (regulator of RNase III)